MFPAAFNEITSALVSLLVGTLLGTEITRFLYRPRVVIRYREISPLKVSDGVHWSIKVTNHGRTVASSCKAVVYICGLTPDTLLHAHEAHPNEFLPSYEEEGGQVSFPRQQAMGPDKFRPVAGESLAWSRIGNPESIDINPGVTEQLDICKVQCAEDGCYVIFPTELGWRRVRCRVRKSKLIGRVLVCPSNEFPTVMHFELLLNSGTDSTFRTIQVSWIRRLRNRLSTSARYSE